MRLDWRPVRATPAGPPVSTSLTADEAAWLQNAARGKHVLEIGSAYGYSAVTMAATARHVLAIDPHEGELPDSLTIMRSHLHAYGVHDRVSIMLGCSTPAMIALRNVGATFDLVFIDGDHAADAVRDDWRNASALIGPGGLLAFHDYDEDTCPGVREALTVPPTLVDTLAIYRPSPAGST